MKYQAMEILNGKPLPLNNKEIFHHHNTESEIQINKSYLLYLRICVE